MFLDYKDEINYRTIGVFFFILLIFVVMIFSNSFFHLRAAMSDRLYGNQETLNNILIVEIDDESINKIGRWPWDRSVFSQLLEMLNESKAIGVDVSFFEPTPNDSSLRNVIELNEKIVLAAEINENQLLTPIFDSDYGYVNIQTDFDGVTRNLRSDLSEDVKPFSFMIYEKAYKKEINFEEKEHLINFASVPGSFDSVNVYDVLYENSIEEIDLENKIVLIGATAPDLHDNFFVPTSEGIPMSGVEVHANVIQNLVLDNFLNKQGNISLLLIVFLSGIVSFFFISRMKIQYSLPLIIGIIFIYVYSAVFVFEKYNYVMDLFFLPLSLLIFTSAGTALNYFEEKKRSSYLTEAFGKYISKDLLSEIIHKKHELKLGGGKRTVTIFFSDIRDFTSFSEKLSPEDLVSLINDYLTEMTRIILNHHGTVDKYIGDAIMAFWNAPLLEENHAILCCESALEQIKILENLREKWVKEGKPEINIGIGIHTGEAIIGNIGSEDRFDYTALGDTINLGSRLEGLTKQYSADILISEETYKLVKERFKFRKLDIVKVKGKAKPITIYELISKDDGEYKKFAEQYEKALELYLKSQFREAMKNFKLASQTNPKDKSSKMFIERCEQYIKNPPEKDWDGSFKFTTK